MKKLFKPTSTTSITLHLTLIVNVCFDESTKFKDFVASKCKHNCLLREVGGQSLLDSYIAIFIHSGLPDHLKQYVAHILDNTITAGQLVDIIHSHQQESIIQTMQSSLSDVMLFSKPNKPKKKQEHEPCCTPGCPRPTMHTTNNCWVPGSLKHDPNCQRKMNRRNKERANEVDDDNDDKDNGSSTSMKIHIDRSFIAKQSDSELLYVSSTELLTSVNAPHAYLTKGATPIIINSGTTSHIHNTWLDFDFLGMDDMNNITSFGD